MVLWNESLNTFAALWLQTLIRACWQGGLALSLVWAACRLLPRLPAAGKCWLWRLAYLKLLIAFLWLPTLDLPLLPSSSPAPATQRLMQAPEPAPSTDVISPTPPAEALPAENSPAIVTSPGLSSSPEVAPSPDVVASAFAPSAGTPTMAAWLLLLWTGVLLWQGGQAIRQAFAVRRLRRSGTPLDGGQLDFWNVALSRDLKLPMVPRLLSSAATNTPLLIGILQPCILLPNSLLSTCTPDELRLILAHELAHVRRRDLLWGWLPLLAGLVCGFHPLVRVAGHELGMAQEIACDEAALHLTGAASAAYGSLLVRVAACFAPHPSRGFGMIGMTESYHTLKRRLSAMKSFPSAPRQYRVVVRFGLLSLGLTSLLPWRVAAQATPPVLPPPAAPVAAPIPTMPVTVPTTPPIPSAATQAPVPAAPVPAVPPTPTVPAQVPGTPSAIGVAPVAAPGRVAPARRTSTPSSWATIISPRRVTRTVEASGVRSGGPAVPPTPATAPPAALSGDPVGVPPTPIPPSPRALPGDPQSVPPTPAPRVAEPPSVGASPTSRSIPFLGDLPILGRLFRYEPQVAAKAPTATRGVPILGDLPILGSLFRIETKSPPTPEKMP